MEKMIDADGDIIDDKAFNFIVSLAQQNTVIVKSDNVFSENNVEEEYTLTRNNTLIEAIKHSSRTGQYNLYKDIFKPAMSIMIDTVEIDTFAMDKIDNEIDDLIDYTCDRMKWEFNPLNNSDLMKITNALKIGPDPFKSLFVEHEHENIIQAICLIIDLDSKIHFVKPDGFTIESVNIDPWEYNPEDIRNEAFSNGYFSGKYGRRFYTPLCGNGVSTAPTPSMISEAKQQMVNSKRSILNSFGIIVEKDIKNVFHISNHYQKILYLRPEDK